VYLPGSRSERRRRTVRCTGYQDALTILREFKDELQREVDGAGPVQDTPRETSEVPTFAEYVAEHWDSIAARQSARVKVRNEGLLRLHLLPFFGSMRLNEIRSIELDDFTTSMRAKEKAKDVPYSPATINTAVRLVKACLNNAVKREVILRAPGARFLPVPEIANELDDREWTAFLAAFDDRDGFVTSYEDPRIRGSVPREIAEIYYEGFRASKPLFALELSTGLRRHRPHHPRMVEHHRPTG
jgi:hypothetical protein